MMAAKSLKGGRFCIPDDGRTSPNLQCVICLGALQDKSYTDSCLHTFCFVCLVKWSKVKPECPLCKQPFKSIYHNVRSNDDYDQYHVPREEPSVVLTNILSYRFMVDVINSSAAREYFSDVAHLWENTSVGEVLPSISHVNPVNVESSRTSYRWHWPVRQTRAQSFRASIYRRNLYSLPLADVTGRFRDCSSIFYRENPAQIARLGPWVQREVDALLPNAIRADAVYDRVMSLISRVDVLSPQFHGLMSPMLGEATSHFVHEFTTFVRSPYDMAGFDQHVQYAPRTRLPRRGRDGRPPPAVNESVVIDADSDVEIIGLVRGASSVVRGASSVAANPSESPIVISDSDSDVVVLSDNPLSPSEVIVINSVAGSQPRAGASRSPRRQRPHMHCPARDPPRRRRTSAAAHRFPKPSLNFISDGNGSSPTSNRPRRGSRSPGSDDSLSFSDTRSLGHSSISSFGSRSYTRSRRYSSVSSLGSMSSSDTRPSASIISSVSGSGSRSYTPQSVRSFDGLPNVPPVRVVPVDISRSFTTPPRGAARMNSINSNDSRRPWASTLSSSVLSNVNSFVRVTTDPRSRSSFSSGFSLALADGPSTSRRKSLSLTSLSSMVGGSEVAGNASSSESCNEFRKRRKNKRQYRSSGSSTEDERRRSRKKKRRSRSTRVHPSSRCSARSSDSDSDSDLATLRHRMICKKRRCRDGSV